MPGNTLGKMFTVTTFGESHGPVIGAIVDGCPPGLALSEADIQNTLDRRKPGTSRYTSQRREADQVKILSGVFEGRTTGTPIGLEIENEQQRPQDYDEIKDKFRPGHADFTYHHKYGIRDYRGSGRASARETAMRVAAGAIAQKYLRDTFGAEIRGCLMQMGDLTFSLEQDTKGNAKVDWDAVNQNPFFCPDLSRIPECEAFIHDLRKAGDSIGTKLYVEATHVPVGLGEPVFDRLDADIAKGLMCVNAVKGVEIGAGFRSVTQRGSEHRDELTKEGFLSNEAGGVLGGISTGQTIYATVAVKPASSILIPGRTLTTSGEPTEVVTKGRHDPCVGLRATPILEAMMALVIMDHALRYRGQCG